MKTNIEEILSNTLLGKKVTVNDYEGKPTTFVVGGFEVESTEDETNETGILILVNHIPWQHGATVLLKDEIIIHENDVIRLSLEERILQRILGAKEIDYPIFIDCIVLARSFGDYNFHEAKEYVESIFQRHEWRHGMNWQDGAHKFVTNVWTKETP